MAHIAVQIQKVQLTVKEVLEGQELDRLSTAYSCQQKLLQAMNIEDSNLRRSALLDITHAAEDSRNMLMLSQRNCFRFNRMLYSPFCDKGPFFQKIVKARPI